MTTNRLLTIVERARPRLDALAKPQGSLGRLEDLAVRLAETQGRLDPASMPRRVILFAGDHGVTASGVGIWPSEVTTAMIATIGAGRATSSALARASNTELVLIDVGSRAPKAASQPNTQSTTLDWRAGRFGTADLAHEPAMSRAVFDSAFADGRRAIDEAKRGGIKVVALGEMGIGNTTPAACLIAYLTGKPSSHVVGDGAGATEVTRAKKHSVVAVAVARAHTMVDQPTAIASICGFEIAALAGAISAAAEANMTVILDGVIVAAAALVARALDPTALRTAIAAHVGAEPGHRLALDALGLDPYLDWNLRLGEGSGALLLLPMLDAAAALLTDVATLAELAP